MKIPDLSVIIIDYKSNKLILSCLSAINKNVSVTHEVLLVDNNKKNRGFAKAANIGAKKAKGKYLLFLNPDCLIKEGDFNEFIEYLNTHPMIGIIGLKMILKDGSTQPYSFGKKYSLLGNALSKFKRTGTINNFSPDWVSGGAMVVRKELFDKIGGFDEQFFMYFEDQDLCLRAKEKAYQIGLYEKITVIHFGGRPATGGAYGNVASQQNMYRDSQNKFIRKHYGLLYSIIFQAIRTIWRMFFHGP